MENITKEIEILIKIFYFLILNEKKMHWFYDNNYPMLKISVDLSKNLTRIEFNHGCKYNECQQYHVRLIRETLKRFIVCLLVFTD